MVSEDIDVDYYFELVKVALLLKSKVDKKLDFERALNELKPVANRLSVLVSNSILSDKTDFDYISILAGLKRLFPDQVSLGLKRGLKNSHHNCNNYQQFGSKGDAVSFLKSKAGQRMVKKGETLTYYYCSEHECFHLRNK